MSTSAKKTDLIPKHIAIIMDGNARWSRSQGVLKSKGHKAGAENAKKIALHAKKLGVEHLTLYAFSSENWSRPKTEVKLLMNLIRQFLKNDIEEILKNDIRLKFIGDLSKLDADIREMINSAVERSQNNSFSLIIALSYGARDEIERAALKYAKALQTNKEAKFEQFLDTYGIPDPDLFIRTSGEIRVSNFLLWQISYSELYFCDTYWPDFNEEKLESAIKEYARRDRRYGLR